MGQVFFIVPLRVVLSLYVLQRVPISSYDLLLYFSSHFCCARCGGHCKQKLPNRGEMQYCYFGIFFKRLNCSLHVIDNKKNSLLKEQSKLIQK